MKKRLIFLVFFLICAASFAFGLNKIRDKQRDWNIYETEHFSLYYYEGEELLAKMAAVYAEAAYLRDSGVMGYQSKSKLPLFIYESHLDFTTTNVTLGFIDEGTGGFTEPYKNRMALPNPGSLEGLREVIYHEITHAIQFNILFGEGMRSYNTLYKDLFVPLWVMEGSAEYCAEDFDSVGDMILRDAVIHDRLIPLEKLEGFYHLEEVYLAYKEAQSVFMYLAGKYGEDKMAQMLSFFRNEMGIDAVMKKTVGKDFSKFSKEWEYNLKKKYWSQVQGRDEPDKYGPQLTDSTSRHIVFNQAPCFSPDGEQIAYVSTRDGHRKIFIMQKDGTDQREVFGSGFEGVSADGFPLSWSPDGNYIYFASRDGSGMSIFRGDVRSGGTEKVVISGIDNAYSPSVSPDGRLLAFIGEANGFTDVCLLDIGTGSVTKITDNIFNNSYVTWSPSGKMLAFTEERGGHDTIAVYDADKGVKKIILKSEGHEYKAPRFVDEKEIIFISDKTGIYNLYKAGVKGGKQEQLTNLANGAFAPSVNGNYAAYAYYEDACYNIYKYQLGRDRELPEIPLIYSDNALMPAAEPKKDPLKDYLASQPIRVAEPGQPKDDEEYTAKIESEASAVIQKKQKYSVTFTPDLVFALLGFSSDTGPVGGGLLSLSDMLGDNNLSLLANFVPGYYGQFDFQYYYAALPFDVAFNFYYLQNVYKLYDIETSEFFSKLDTTEIGGSVGFKYPFNKYADLSLILGSRKISDNYTNLETEHEYTFNQDETNVLNTAALIFSHEYSAWRDYWPYTGYSVMLYAAMAEKMFSGTKSYSIYEFDLRRHFDLSFISQNNMSISFRLLGALTQGDDRPYFIFGGLNTVRGLPYAGYLGDRVAIFNTELRHTVAKNMDFQLWPITAVMIKSIKFLIFNDAGAVNAGEITRFGNEDIKNGAGIGFVVDTFIIQRQYLPLKFEVARRTDVNDENWRFYFSMATGF